jgi:hypothetical protein
VFFGLSETYAWYDLFYLRPDASERYVDSIFYPESYSAPSKPSRIELLQIAHKLGVSSIDRLTCVPRHLDGTVEIWDSDVGKPIAKLRRSTRVFMDEGTAIADEPVCPRCGGRGTFVRTALKCVPCDFLLGGF